LSSSIKSYDKIESLKKIAKSPMHVQDLRTKILGARKEEEEEEE
jgi:hypothetical protein